MTKTYHIWTEGCQMNLADSQRVAIELERLGYAPSERAEQADVVVLNTCVVRQQAEEKAVGRLWSLKPAKLNNPDMVLALMGCMVGVKDAEPLRKQFPFVDVFMPPSEPGPLVRHLRARGDDPGADLERSEVEARHAIQDEFRLPGGDTGTVSAHVPVVYGCNHVCTFCIIPYRRGQERSRPVGDIAHEVRALAAQGVKEFTLLGQIVDRYGYDVADGPRLPDLLRVLNGIDGVERIRFLTSHPNYMDGALLDCVAELPKVMPHIEVPVQAGDDAVLAAMRRGYTSSEYRELVGRIRARLPGCSIATDIIVGFPGESEAQFMRTYDLLAELRLDVAHLAMYSPRPNTASARRLADDVPAEEKLRRLKALDALQEGISREINESLVGSAQHVLVDGQHKGKWRGRTPTNKLVFFGDDSRDWLGQTPIVTIVEAGAWSMQGALGGAPRAVTGAPPRREVIPLSG
ncbi:MAG: tRNA (N6-isopentenyl adenosine(37)-C2)-methylthiotransferase MiaB [Chloroflexi bacterium]|nr:tRNA (N6-isopentenyl adenosine(37)-C2)-methylthiotransferase MiaB [Chloroflexota bacterium]